jgi:hypothetical protein
MKIGPVEQSEDHAKWSNVRDLIFPMRFSYTLVYRFEDKTYEGIQHELTNGEEVGMVAMDLGSVYTMLNSGVLVLQDGTVPALVPIDIEPSRGFGGPEDSKAALAFLERRQRQP